MIDHEPDEQAKRSFRWKAALWSGLSVGTLFLFFSKGIPWSSLGFGTSAMGREFLAKEGPGFFVFNILVHMTLAVLYAFAIGVVVYRLNIVAALVAGAILGLALYGVNSLIFHYAVGPASSGEFSVAVTHVFFGVVCAAAYKAFSVPIVQRRTT